MNRHERRRALAMGKEAGKTGKMPPLYGETCDAMAFALRMWCHHFPNATPRFTLPDKDVALIGALDHACARIAKNQEATDIVRMVCHAAVMLGGDRNMPTVMMLQAVLENAGVPIERVSLGELGLTQGGGRN